MHWTESALVEFWSRFEHSEVLEHIPASERIWLNLDTGERRAEFEIAPRHWRPHHAISITCGFTAFQPHEPSVLGMLEFHLAASMSLPQGAAIPDGWHPTFTFHGESAKRSWLCGTRLHGDRQTALVQAECAWQTPVTDQEQLEGIVTHWVVQADVLVQSLASLAEVFPPEGE